MPLPPHAMAHPRMPADHLSAVKQMPVVPRGSPVYPQQQQLPEMYYSDSRPPPSASQYEPSQYPTGECQKEFDLKIIKKCTVTNSLPFVIFQVIHINSHHSTLRGVTYAILLPPVSQLDPHTKTPTLVMALQSAPTRPPTLVPLSPILTLHTMTPEVATGATQVHHLPPSLTHLKGMTLLEWVLHLWMCLRHQQDKLARCTTQSPVLGTDTHQMATTHQVPSLLPWGHMAGWVSKFCVVSIATKHWNNIRQLSNSICLNYLIII